MFRHLAPCLLTAQVLLFGQALAQASCSALFNPTYPSPSLASGYQARLIATGLTRPRGMVIDANNNLLVVEVGRGVTSQSIVDNSGCVSLANRHDVVRDTSLTHGIALSLDGRTLYSSSADVVYAWPYDASTSTITGPSVQVINGMAGTDHITRTLEISRDAPGMIVVNRGSLENLDPVAEDITRGISQVKAFNVTGVTSPINFASGGIRLGWGLRNDVGVREHPVTGGIWTVENSADQITRNGVDIHQNNPAEELNFLGYLDGTPYAAQGSNFGYPGCLAAWDPSGIPNANGLQVGQQFAIGDQSSARFNDTYCRNNVTPPRLVFPAHWAPLDMIFNADGTTAYITFHGSWNSAVQVGYKVSRVQFANGQPVEPSTSTTAAIDVMVNPDNSVCPSRCFRPVGLAWDSQGRLYVGSDSTGEIYLITAANGAGIGGARPSSSASATRSSVTASSTAGGSSTGSSASATGGSSTGGSASPTRTASGGSATGGSASSTAPGSSATGGSGSTTRTATSSSAIGGSATGGSATSGAASVTRPSTGGSATGSASSTSGSTQSLFGNPFARPWPSRPTRARGPRFELSFGRGQAW